MEITSENRAFGGRQIVASHLSEVCNCDMTFALFLPPQAADGPVPLIWFLSGLTCTHENAMTKAGAQAWCAEQGVAMVFPDTSPRGADVANDAAYDLGQGAGFYVDATEAPWVDHFQMESYVMDELPRVLFANFPLDEYRQSITGHSMGGHGALTLAMKYPGRFSSVSAFSPICNPSDSDWGCKQFTAYLGEHADWEAHDASRLMREDGIDVPVLIDTGTEDQFGDLLKTEALAKAMVDQRVEHVLRLQKHYDHSYFFVASFMKDHVAFHSDALRR
ncbi:S-formylglutathione hydrolase [Phaeobacter sp. J2-8]|uniref:S-formylglutathione hydrolase n=1 Tax=Phaeobacter sp. J2-8 TaxID=2931394 RepID=UPI001FD099BF|nr:S-formylglutathione hydrolase [Phaeobacter sp. J2-8]MCJ7871391.1 S-formylglutathione hydrolase [Phaeobacter sp. J2-8]